MTLKQRHCDKTLGGLRLHFQKRRDILLPCCLEGGHGSMVVYLDGVIGLNFLVDWMLLLGVNRLSGYPPGIGRAAAAAVFGGGYSGLCFIPGFAFLASSLWRIVCLGIISMAAFGLNRSALSRGTLFVFLSMALGGLAISFHAGDFLGLVVSAGILALLCRMGFCGQIVGRKLLPVELTHRGKKVSFLALRDTGNTLRDPISGEPVLIAGPEIANGLLGLEISQLRDPLQTIESHAVDGLRLIPYNTVGSDSGFLLGLRCDQVAVNGKKGKRLVAFAPENFPGGEYDGLTGGV